MLSHEENELLCRVGPGTPMGNVFRRYWIPALLSEEIPEPGGPPARVRLLGEDLVAFRDSLGRVGLIDDKCAHRRAPLFFGRPEEGGLRCVYHGWKYDVDGNVLDTPCEPVNSMLKHGVKLVAYPCREVHGLIFTYMGPKEKMPLLPNYEWMTNVEKRRPAQSKYTNENNWLQSVEGDCDSSHTAYLHRKAGDASTIGDTLDLAPGMGEGLTFELEQGPWYIKAASIRHVSDRLAYVRTNAFIPPCIGIPPGGVAQGGVETEGFHAIYQVPADDTTTLRYDLYGRASNEGGGLYSRHEVDGRYRKLMNQANDYLIDRAKQQTSIFSGIDSGNHTQDAMVTEGMGPIVDRTKEHLGACDAQPLAMRAMLLKAVRDVQEGKDPPGVAFRPEDNRFDDFFLTVAVLPKDAPWRDPAQVRALAVDVKPALAGGAR